MGLRDWIAGKFKQSKDSQETSAPQKILFIIRYSPNVTISNERYIKDVLNATTGMPDNAKINLNESTRPPDKDYALAVALIHLKEKGLDSKDYDFAYWPFHDLSGGEGFVVQAEPCATPKTGRPE